MVTLPNQEDTLSLPALGEMLKNSIRLSAMVWEERKGMVIILALVFLAVSVAPFLQSGSLGLLINELVTTEGGDSPGLGLLVGLLIAAGTVPALLGAVQNYLMRLFWFFLSEKFELLIIKRKGEIDVAMHEDPKRNNLFNRITERGIWSISNFVDRQFYLVQNLAEVAIGAGILIYARWWVFAIIFFGTIPELIVELRYGRDVWGIYGARGETRRRFWDIKEHFDGLAKLVELKLFQNIGHFTKIIRELFRTFQDEEKKNERKKLARELLSLIVSQAVIAFAIVFFVMQVVQGNMLVGTLTFFLASMASFRTSLSSFFNNLGGQYRDSLFISDVFELVDMPPVITRPEKGVILDPAKTPEIEFRDVSFVYPGTTREILRGVSFRVLPGEKVALIGVNGAGKTTVVKLLCRFYDATKGSILVDGHDLKEIDLESWYYQLGVLFQDYAQYHFVVKETIALGRTGELSSLEKVKEAARASEADAFIEAWEGAYDQMLGRQFTGGIEPSIGQWQKLALARTFYRDPRILILDEPTSSIDAEAEAKIFEKLESLPPDRSVLLISHRFSTVRHANRIIVIEGGAITEAGTHKELVAKKGTYARLFKLQAKGYE